VVKHRIRQWQMACDAAPRSTSGVRPS
jgi:hypothetical protein